MTYRLSLPNISLNMMHADVQLSICKDLIIVIV